MHEACRKPDGLITGHLRHFTVSRVFFSSEGESKTRVTYETSSLRKVKAG